MAPAGDHCEKDGRLFPRLCAAFEASLNREDLDEFERSLRRGEKCSLSRDSMAFVYRHRFVRAMQLGAMSTAASGKNAEKSVQFRLAGNDCFKRWDIVVCGWTFPSL